MRIEATRIMIDALTRVHVRARSTYELQRREYLHKGNSCTCESLIVFIDLWPPPPVASL